MSSFSDIDPLSRSPLKFESLPNKFEREDERERECTIKLLKRLMVGDMKTELNENKE